MRDPLAQVAPGVLVATAELWSSTCTVIVSGARCVVVDPGIAAAEVAAVADELDRRGITLAAGFSTHPHWDHLLWSPRWPVARWATPEATKYATDHHAEILAEAEAESPGLRPMFAGLAGVPGATLPWPGPEAVVVPYPGHCPGSAALLVPDLGVIVLGDMLSDIEVPLLDLTSADPVHEYEAGIALLLRTAEAAGVTTVIPGHGTVCDLAGLRRRAEVDLEYLDAVTAGREVDDPRLADPWVAGEHATQVRHLAGRA